MVVTKCHTYLNKPAAKAAGFLSTYNLLLPPSINTLTANYEYSRSFWKNLPVPIQMQLSVKPKTFVNQFFIAFLESTLNLNILKKQNEPHRSSISEVTDSERRAYLNA